MRGNEGAMYGTTIMTPGTGGHNGYVRILHDSKRLVERLARHLSGQGLESLPAEIESLRSIGRIMIRRIYASNISGLNVTFVHSSVSQLERALSEYERVIVATPNEVGIAMKLHDSIRQQIEYLCSIAESLDRGEHL